ncbi:hypothetical protein HNR40_000649 [Nonomuraea endophytica]|uniref:Uncharacterized protein n=1 Tax=Nonomuraea endophytica TaxID=714136 RepID=A0A7W8EDB4_9ACTN|nr:hypothetical protein [Nonomuraea endophytica]
MRLLDGLAAPELSDLQLELTLIAVLHEEAERLAAE